MTTKVCSMCSALLPASLFYKRARSKDGLTARCKKCVDVGIAAYVERNKEKTKLYRHEHYTKNKGRYLSEQRQKREANPEQYRAEGRRRYWRDPELSRSRTVASKGRRPDRRAHEIAQTLIARITGIPRGRVPKVLIEAKAMQIKVRREIECGRQARGSA